MAPEPSVTVPDDLAQALRGLLAAYLRTKGFSSVDSPLARADPAIQHALAALQRVEAAL